MTELLPCPFCGATPSIVVIEPHSHAGGIADFMPDHPGSAYTDCACGVGIIDASVEVVTKRWNTRAAPAMPATDAVREAVEDLEDFSERHLEKNPKMQKAIAAILAALSHPSQGGWQPIETAPKDGTRILVPYDGHTRVAAWGKTSHVRMYGFCLADQGAEDFDLVQVDLWQPLPAPPEVQP